MLKAPSGKSYIGQTKHTARKRFSQHLGAAANKNNYTAIARAIRKYGPQNFIIQQLLVVDNSELDYYEEKFIDAFRTLAPYGYNLTSGGHRSQNISEELREKLRENNRGPKNPFYGRKHTTQHKERIGKISKELARCRWAGKKNPKYGLHGADNPAAKAVRQYAMDGTFIQEFDSITMAAEALDIHTSGISSAATGGLGSSAGWQWRFASAPPPGAYKPAPHCKAKKVAMYDKNGALLRVFDSITVASLETGMASHTISKSMRGLRIRNQNISWKLV